jgi:hypothetical protein
MSRVLGIIIGALTYLVVAYSVVIAMVVFRYRPPREFYAVFNWLLLGFAPIAVAIGEFVFTKNDEIRGAIRLEISSYLVWAFVLVLLSIYGFKIEGFSTVIIGYVVMLIVLLVSRKRSIPKAKV